MQIGGEWYYFPTIEVDFSTIEVDFIMKRKSDKENQEILTDEQLLKEILPALISGEYIVKMPPVSEYTITGEIVEVKKGKPSKIEE